MDNSFDHFAKDALLTEPLLTFSEVGRQMRPNGQRPIHPSTLMRWRQYGIRGIKLEAVRLGGRWVTSAEAVSRFIARLSDTKSQPVIPMSKQNARSRDLDRAVAAEGL